MNQTDHQVVKGRVPLMKLQVQLKYYSNRFRTTKIIMVKENLYNVIKCFSNKALKYRADTHLCNTSSLVTLVETAI